MMRSITTMNTQRKTTAQRCGRLVIGIMGAILTVGLAGCSSIPTTTTLSSTPNPSAGGQAVALKATVTYNGGPPQTPTSFPVPGGTVTLMDTSTVPATILDTQPVSNGTANFSLLNLLAGTHPLTAAFNGYSYSTLDWSQIPPARYTTIYSASTSAPLTQIVNPLGTLATTTGLTASPNPSVTGQSVTLTAAVSPNGPALAAPTGSVTFQMGSTLLNTVPLINGTATLTTSTLPGGSDTLTASYNGDNTFAGSSGSFVQTVNPVTQTSLTSNFNPSFPGQSVTFTAAVTAANSPTPTGTVQFAVDGANVGGLVTLDGSGKATDTEAGLTLGTHTITVAYTPTGLFLGNAGATFTQTVNPHLSPQYVSPSGGDLNDGSQASPKQTIQAAVNATQSGDTVIVEGGTYTGNGNRDIDFGGRNITVQAASGDPTQAVIDCGGSASSLHRGFYFHSGETNAVVSGLTVRNGYQFGGAVDIARGSAVTFTNCILTGNVGHGGSIFPTVNLGGGVDNAGTATLTNCTITGNSATSGGGVYNAGTMTLTNDILYGDTGGEISGTVTATHCDVQGGYAGAGNLNADPLFVNAAAGDFHLRSGSPCLGAGTSAGAPATDRDGTLRPSPPSIGAYDRVTTSHTHLLWNNPDGRVMLWSVAPNGTHTQNTFGPYTDDGTPATPWHATALATGLDGKSHILWTNPDGRVILWTVDDSGTFTYQVYGPYTDDGTAATPWSATALSVGADNLVHILWTNPDGRVILWNVDGAFNFTLAVFGPYTDDGTPNTPWHATALATGPDSVSRLLWTNPDGRVILWKIDDSFRFAFQVYGPYTDGSPSTPWSATAVSVGPDNMAHLLWTNPDSRVILWNVDASFGFSYGVFGAPTDGSPSSPWGATALATGPDGLSHVLWTNPDGGVLLRGVNSAFGFTDTVYGPLTDGAAPNVWSATAVSAGT